MTRPDAAPAPWFERRIRRGLAALITLRLEGHPAADVIEATARVWAQALWPGRDWDEAADAARIGEAFRLLAARETRWPAPAVWLRHLPARAPQAALAEPAADAAGRARVAAQLAALSRRLRAGGTKTTYVRASTGEAPRRPDDQQTEDER